MNDSLKYIEVAVEFNSRNLYTYCISGELIEKIEVGSRILVPFGKRELTGYVEKINDKIELGTYKIKEISFIIDEKPLISKNIIQLCRWASNHFLAPQGYLYRCAYPPGTNIASNLLISKNNEISTDEYIPYLSEKERTLLRLIGGKKFISVKTLNKNASVKSIYTLVSQLKEKGIIRSWQKTGKPKSSEKFKTTIRKIDQLDFAGESGKDKLGKNQINLLRLLEASGEIDSDEALRKTGISPASLKSLESMGLIKTAKERTYRMPEYETDRELSQSLELNVSQSKAAEKIIKAVKGKENITFLLHGITGSGKTEIYMQVIQYLLSIKKQALLLVPEIALTPQIVSRFRARFPGKTAVLHSSLSKGERYDEWYRIYEGKAQITIGTRSAVFAPLKNIGIIIIDEEHDNSYKQDETPCYDARELAMKLGELESVPVVLGSASPSVESFYKAETGEYTYLYLPERATGTPLPSVNIVDMKKEKNKIISSELAVNVQNACEKGEQIILFLNRRGYHRIVHCTSCGAILTCKNCSVSLVLHRSDNMMHCHYCDSITRKPLLCPSCGKKKMKGLGRGTELLEEEIGRILQGKRIQRFDKDSLKGKKKLSHILSEFKKGDIDVLAGTQMLSLGHDYPNVTLVGVIAADLELNFPDFRAAERAFQILLQVSGRCGRNNIPGTSYIQTYQPDHYVLESLKKHDYESFYKKEILFRKNFKYPPFSKLINITFSGRKQIDVKKASHLFTVILKKRIPLEKARILGPAEPLRWKIRGKYRRQILIKYINDYPEIKEAIDKSISDDFQIIKNVFITIDVNPANLL